MTPQQLIAKGGLYFERITQGMEAYQWESRYMGPAEAKQFLAKLWRENGRENAFAECYYPFLERESQERVLSVLSGQEQAYLEALAAKENELILPLDERLLDIAVSLNDKEMLFFTFYFTGNPCTVWGNYKQEYLIFTPRKKI